MENDVAIKLTEHDQEIKQLNKRMAKVEDLNKSVNELALSVKELALNLTRMADEQKADRKANEEDRKRICALEQRPAKRAEQVWGYILSTTISVIVGAIIGALISLVIK